MPFESAETVLHDLPLHVALGCDTAKQSSCLSLATSKCMQPLQLKPLNFFFKSHLLSSKHVISVGWRFLSLEEVFHINWNAVFFKRKAQKNSIMTCSCHEKITYIVDKETRVLKAPGVMVLMWLSYRERSLTELRPAKVSLFIQLMELLLSILQGLKQGIRNYWEGV